MTDFNSSSDNAPSGLTNNTLAEADCADYNKSSDTFCEPTCQGTFPTR